MRRDFGDRALRGSGPYGTKDSAERGMECTELLLGAENRLGFRRYRGPDVLDMSGSRVPDRVRDPTVLREQQRQGQKDSASDHAQRMPHTVSACHGVSDPKADAGDSNVCSLQTASVDRAPPYRRLGIAHRPSEYGPLGPATPHSEAGEA